MAQLNFHKNLPMPPIIDDSIAASNGTLSFSPFYPSGSISWATINFLISYASSNKTLSVGLYSLTGSTLSLANSASRSVNSSFNRIYISLTATSATQNITPGNWWLGLLISTAGTSGFAFAGQTRIDPSNAFPGAFIGGRMTDSTNALPASYATSDLDTTGR